MSSGATRGKSSAQTPGSRERAVAALYSSAGNDGCSATNKRKGAWTHVCDCPAPHTLTLDDVNEHGHGPCLCDGEDDALRGPGGQQVDEAPGRRLRDVGLGRVLREGGYEDRDASCRGNGGLRRSVKRDVLGRGVDGTGCIGVRHRWQEQDGAHLQGPAEVLRNPRVAPMRREALKWSEAKRGGGMSLTAPRNTHIHTHQWPHFHDPAPLGYSCAPV